MVARSSVYDGSGVLCRLRGWTTGNSGSGKVMRVTKNGISIIMLYMRYLRPGPSGVPSFVFVTPSHCDGLCCPIFMTVALIFACGTIVPDADAIPVCPAIMVGGKVARFGVFCHIVGCHVVCLQRGWCTPR